MNKEPFFIVGCQRSGTTLLRLILNAHSRIAIPGEGTFWMPLLRRVGSQKNTGFGSRKWERVAEYIFSNEHFEQWRIDRRRLLTELKKQKPADLSNLMNIFYSVFAESAGKPLWGDKTPSFFRMIPQLNILFPGARFIHIVRDGRDVWLSWSKLDRSKKNVNLSAFEWQYKVKIIETAFDNLDKNLSLTIRFEDLLAEPETVLNQICSFLGVAFESGMLKFWEQSNRHAGRHRDDFVFKPITPSRAGRWKQLHADKTLSGFKLKSFEVYGGPRLEKYGYECLSSEGTGISHKIAAIFGLAAGMPIRLIKVFFVFFNFFLSAGLGLKLFKEKTGKLPADESNKKLRVLIINKFLYPKGGCAISSLTDGALLQEHGHTVFFWGMKDPRNPDYLLEDIFIRHIDFNKKTGILRKIKYALHILYSFEARKKIKRIIRLIKPDIVHLNNFAHQITPSILAPFKKAGIPVTMTMRDYKLVCPTYSLLRNGKPCELCRNKRFFFCLIHKCNKNSFFKSLINTIEMFLHHNLFRLYKQIDVFISPSKFLIEKLYSMGWRRRIVYLPNAVRLSGNTGKPISDYIVYAGRLSREKGLYSLLRAVKGTGIPLKIIGSGPLKNELKQMVHDYNITEVSFHGYLPHDRLILILKNALCSVLPSIWYENNPRIILESFSLGVPVAASRIGGMLELVEDRVRGVLFNPGDNEDIKKKLLYLYNNRGKLSVMRKNCLDFIKADFTEKIHYNRLIEIYKSMKVKIPE